VATIKILTIAGSDSGGGAGIQADIKTIFSLDCYPTVAITAVTSQNTRGVERIFKIPPDEVYSQIKAVLDDIEISAIKIGMVPDRETAEAIARILPKNIPVILDPVMVSTSGHALSDGVDMLVSTLLKKTFVITPNIPEAEALSGLAILNVDSMIKAGEALVTKGCENALIKGGHLPQCDNRYIENILVTQNGFIKIPNLRTSKYSLHGAGCSLSTALACFIAKTSDLFASTKMAIEYIQESASISEPIGAGHVPLKQVCRKTNPK